MRYIQLMQMTRFVGFQLANFFLFFFSGKYLNVFIRKLQIKFTGLVKKVSDSSLKSSYDTAFYSKNIWPAYGIGQIFRVRTYFTKPSFFVVFFFKLGRSFINSSLFESQ